MEFAVLKLQLFQLAYLLVDGFLADGAAGLVEVKLDGHFVLKVLQVGFQVVKLDIFQLLVLGRQ